MSTKSPKARTRKRPTKEDAKLENVAPVHRPLRTQSVESTKSVKSARSSNNERSRAGVPSEADDNSDSRGTYTLEDDNENTIQPPVSRDISIDTGLQINSKIENGIIGFMETEMKKEKTKYGHFTDSRPQSLSFYEEERAPEELSGQLEPLSPEERRVYKRRKDERKIDIELDASTYKEIQNVLNREKEEALLAGIIKSQRSKSRKKQKQFDSQESIAGLGDSREHMIPPAGASCAPAAKRAKSNKRSKRRECSPGAAGAGGAAAAAKRKHRRRDEREREPPRSDITAALDELQDDVFEKEPGEVPRYDGQRPAPLAGRPGTVYVQRKSGFEPTPRDRLFSVVQVGRADGGGGVQPVQVAGALQRRWLPLATLCHGLLAGLALAHAVAAAAAAADARFERQFAPYADAYAGTFSLLCTVCLVSVCDRYDVKRLDALRLGDLVRRRKGAAAVAVYSAALLVHLANAAADDRIGLRHQLLAANGSAPPEPLEPPLPPADLQRWNALSLWRALLAILGWVLVALSPQEDLLHARIHDLEQYLQAP